MRCPSCVRPAGPGRHRPPLPAGQEDGNGFVFADYSAFDMQYVISQAVNLYRTDIHRFRQVQKRGMTDDFSWDASAGAYESLYQHITGQTRSTK